MVRLGGLWSPPLRVQRGVCPRLEGARQRPPGDTAGSLSRFGDGAAGGGGCGPARCRRCPSSAPHEARAAAGARGAARGRAGAVAAPWGVQGVPADPGPPVWGDDPHVPASLSASQPLPGTIDCHEHTDSGDDDVDID